MDESVENDVSGKRVAEETVGSVTVPIFHSPTRILVRRPSDDNGDGSTAFKAEYKTYDSYVITYYEGSVRRTRRRSTLEKARKLASEIATRIHPSFKGVSHPVLSTNPSVPHSQRIDNHHQWNEM